MWYVDNNKVLHMEAKLVDDLINNLKNNFWELVVTRGKKHKCLVMNIDIAEAKKVEIEMKEQLFEAIEAFGEILTKKKIQQNLVNY